MSSIVRVGIVGCGEVAQIIHLPTLLNLRDQFRVTAICDVSQVVLDGVGDRYDIKARFRDYRELVASAEVDAVLIANPHVFHAEVAMAAMAAGKHVLIEKPMCMSLKQADELLAIECKSGVIAQVGFMRRHAPAFTEAVKLVREMTDIRLARVHDVIGRNPLIISQIFNVIRPTELTNSSAEELLAIQNEMIKEAIGPTGAPLDTTYLLLLGLASHDTSAMRGSSEHQRVSSMPRAAGRLGGPSLRPSTTAVSFASSKQQWTRCHASMLTSRSTARSGSSGWTSIPHMSETCPVR